LIDCGDIYCVCWFAIRSSLDNIPSTRTIVQALEKITHVEEAVEIPLVRK
jgi:hypothetical protein